MLKYLRENGRVSWVFAQIACVLKSRSSTVKDEHKHECVISFILLGLYLTMEQHEQWRFEKLFGQCLQSLKIQRKWGKIIEG